MSRNPLKEKSLLFALRIIKLYEILTSERKEYILAKQLMRSGTNPGAMAQEASFAESRSDFIHKLAIAKKELAESKYWLELIWRSNYLSDDEYKSINNDATEILKLLTSSINTAKKNK